MKRGPKNKGRVASGYRLTPATLEAVSQYAASTGQSKNDAAEQLLLRSLSQELAMNTTYYNIPSDSPISKTEAYKRAIERFRVNQSEARYECAGITWQGQHGTVMYAEWDELPAPTA